MKIRSIIDILIGLVAGYFTYYLYTNKMETFAIMTLVISILFMVLFVKSLASNVDPYEAELNKILKTYEAILLEVEVLPKVTDKKVVRTKYFKDLVNVQFEIRKPIYYLRTALFCEFLVSNDELVYIYTLKKDEEYISKTEDVLEEKEYKNQEELKEQINKDEEKKSYFLNDEERKDIIYNIVIDDDVKEEAPKEEVITANQIKSSFEESNINQDVERNNTNNEIK